MPLKNLPLLALITFLSVLHGEGATSIAQLENKLREIDEEQEQLAAFIFQTSVGAIGYRSKTYPASSPQQNEWIRIDLPAEQEIDLIALVPSIWRGIQSEFLADGFPLEFEIIVGNTQHPNGQSIAKFTAEDQLLPRVAPVLIPCPGTKAQWVKLHATQLSPRAWDGEKTLQLSEIIVFQGTENIALHCPVSTSSEGPGSNQGARKKRFLVDGSLPYLMNSSGGKTSQAFITYVPDEHTASFSIDLGRSLPVNRLRLHSTDVSDTAPQASRANYTSPKHLTLEGANQPDFSDATLLCEHRQKSIYDTSPIINLRFAQEQYRYLRIAIPEPDRPLPAESPITKPIIGFAEIEIFSQGHNILLGKNLLPNFSQPPSIDLSRLTDGSNIFGQILDTRQWIEQLGRRHDLSVKRPKIAAQLSDEYQQQERNLKNLKTLSLILGSAVIVLFLLSQIYRLRELANLRRRFAADLHDEIGANLHAIGLLSDIAKEEAQSPTTSSSLLESVQEIRTTTERTADAVRHCANTLQPRTPIGTFRQDMQRIAHRMMDDLHYEITVTGEEHIDRLKPRTRADLFLFYKECLVNISRHSGATSFTANVEATDKKITLNITDNGEGLDPKSPPPSIKRRAKILRARLKLISPPAAEKHGTQIILNLPKRKFIFF